MIPADGIYIGLMSGTSLDGIDAVAARFEQGRAQLIAEHSHTLPDTLKQQLLALMLPREQSLLTLGQLDLAVAEVCAEAVQALLHASQLRPEDIRAIGSHGQTILHAPEHFYTLQIGDANTIAERTGITTVADFRRRDMAAGGQGAPLVPAFHQAVFHSPERDRVIANIGGIANITLLPRDAQQTVTGFDTGPGNMLLDSWIHQQQGLYYDENGDWAASGSVDESLLHSLLSLAYFSQPAPKSTGREQFNLSWLESHLAKLDTRPAAQDIQASLLELTARTLSDEISAHAPSGSEVFLCGGGSHNRALLQRLNQLLPDYPIATTEALGIAPDWVEAVAFAWLAQQTMAGASGNLPAVTGAQGTRILGAIYQA